jgi:hypothetical protein
MITSFLKIFSKKINVIIAFVLSIIFFLFLRIFPYIKILTDFFQISGITFQRGFDVVWGYMYESIFHATIVEQIVVIVFPVFLAVNIVIFIIYLKQQRKYFSTKGTALSFSGTLLGFFGVGCLSCGALFFAPLISLIGFGGLLKYGAELSLLGLVFILFSIIYLLKQLTKPLVC